MKQGRRWLWVLRSYVLFFLLTGFVTTCCMMLFLRLLQYSGSIVYAENNVRTAALLTLANVLFLAFLFTAVDEVRRWYMVERPVRRILEGAERLMHGDFSARIEPFHSTSIDNNAGFDRIIDCFNRLAEELGGLETLRTDFIANVSHEMKTPLAVIQNYSVLLQQPNLPETARIEYARAIDAASRRFAELVENILKLNKLENQQLYPETRVYDLGEQLCECLLYFEEQWEQKDIALETDLAEEVYVESDPALLALVWNNLFSNAFKFTEPGGSVAVTLRVEGEYALVEVADTGCGIPPEVGRHIFEKFYQGDTSHSAQGNGLGLALVKRVIDIVQGDISVRSEVGKGSAFTVRIRRVADSTARTAQLEQPERSS